MALRSRILGVGMRRRSRRVSARWTFTQAQSTPHQSSTTTSPLFPAPRSDTCGSWASLATPERVQTADTAEIHAVRGMAVQHETDPSPHLLHATARGQFDLGELTTYVNDALMLAPSMLLTPAVTWRAVDDDSSTSACPTAQSRRPHESMSMSRAAWSTSAPPIAGQLSRAD
jgi:C1A family cysteine protease